jgi:DNA-binding protein HU-beta
MNKKELVHKYRAILKSESTLISESTNQVNALLDAILEVVKEHKMLKLLGHGTYQVVTRKARKGRNPKTGEEIQIPAKDTLKFKAGKNWDDK